jgi:hypothetical protein
MKSAPPESQEDEMTKRGWQVRLAAIALAVLTAVSTIVVPIGSQSVGAEDVTSLRVALAGGEYMIGGATFEVQIRLQTGMDPVNAVQAYLRYPVDRLEVVGIPATAGSFLQYWMPEVMVDPGQGTIHLAAALPSGFAGGFTGDGLVATVTFRTKAVTGVADVTFDRADCFVMRSSDSTDVLSGCLPGSYSIVDHMTASLSMTGALRVSGQAVEAEYQLVADSARIPLTSAAVQSITRSLPGGGTEVVVPDDASGDLWVNVLQAQGSYSYAILMQPLGGVAATYLAGIDWYPSSVSFGTGGTWTRQSGLMYIPYSCGLDLSAAAAIAHFDADGLNPTLDSVPATRDLLFSISHPGGEYGFVFTSGGALTLATLVQPRTGDLNHDGIIGITDLSMLLASWGAASASTEADISVDLSVNIADLSVLLSRWTPVG